MRFTFLCLSLLSLTACDPSRRVSDKPLESVASVDLDRYVGKWYEIARFPAFFQKGCVAVTATYSLREDGRVDVLNECRIDTIDGDKKEARAIATPVKDSQNNTLSNAKLKVRFDSFPANLFPGDYWVIMLDEQDYQYAVVSEPEGRYLWILSRTPQMDPSLYERLVSIARDMGFLVDQLVPTLQPNAPE